MKFTFDKNYQNRFNGPNNVMMDIEGLGQGPGGVVTSIGAVQFNAITGETFSQFKANIGIQSSLNRGLKIDESTLKWWFDQSKEAQQAMLENAIPIEDALSALLSWSTRLKDQNGNPIDRNNVWWWANGVTYDFGLTDTIFRACNKTYLPWQFRNVMDYRTLRQLFGYKSPDEYYNGVVKHDALKDCEVQIKQVRDIFEILAAIKPSK